MPAPSASHFPSKRFLRTQGSGVEASGQASLARLTPVKGPPRLHQSQPSIAHRRQPRAEPQHQHRLWTRKSQPSPPAGRSGDSIWDTTLERMLSLSGEVLLFFCPACALTGLKRIRILYMDDNLSWERPTL